MEIRCEQAYSLDWKRIKDKEAIYNEVLSTDPTNVKALLQRSFVEENLGNYVGALTDLNHAVALRPSNELLNDQVYLFEKLGRTTDALADLESINRAAMATILEEHAQPLLDYQAVFKGALQMVGTTEKGFM